MSYEHYLYVMSKNMDRMTDCVEEISIQMGRMNDTSEGIYRGDRPDIGIEMNDTPHTNPEADDRVTSAMATALGRHIDEAIEANGSWHALSVDNLIEAIKAALAAEEEGDTP
jgi:hypothetical protein